MVPVERVAYLVRHVADRVLRIVYEGGRGLASLRRATAHAVPRRIQDARGEAAQVNIARAPAKAIQPAQQIVQAVPAAVCDVSRNRFRKVEGVISGLDHVSYGIGLDEAQYRARDRSLRRG